MFVSPRELFEKDNVVLPRYTESEVNAALDELDTAVQQPDFPAAMDELYDRDTDRWCQAKDAMYCLPSEAVHASYGTDTLAWLAITSVFESDTGPRLADLERLAGYDTELLLKARKWCTESVRTFAFGRMTLNQYGMSSAVLHKGFDHFDLPQMLREAAQPGVEISDKRANDYKLVPVTTKPDRIAGYTTESYKDDAHSPDNRMYKLYADAPVGVVLTYKGWPNAMIGLGLSSPYELMVNQLQSVRAHQVVSTDKKVPMKRRPSRGLMVIDWQRLMVGVGQQIAAGSNLESVAIQTGEKNRWALEPHPGESEPPLTVQKAYDAYDAPADRLGFKRGKDRNWHKPLGNR